VKRAHTISWTSIPEVVRGGLRARISNSTSTFISGPGRLPLGSTRDSVEHVGYEARTPWSRSSRSRSPCRRRTRGAAGQDDSARRRSSWGRTAGSSSTSPDRSGFIGQPLRNLGIVVGSFTGTREAELHVARRGFPRRESARVSITFAPARREREWRGNDSLPRDAETYSPKECFDEDPDC